MSLSNSMASYEDLTDALEKALTAPNGVRIRTEDRGAATHLRQRLNKFRQLLRQQSTTIYPKEDPKYNASVYDCLVFRVDDEGVVAARGAPLTVEEL